MHKLGLALFFAILGLAPAQAQPVTNPAPVGAAGAYNSAPPTCTPGNFCWFQLDVNGNLKIVGTFTPSGTQAVSIAAGQVASGAFASGSIASGAMAAGSMVDLLTVIGTKAAGTAATNSLLSGSVFNTTIPAPTAGQQVATQSDSTGSIQVNNEGRKATCSASIANTVAAASATDIFTITGSASKTIRVTRLTFSGQATSSTNVAVDVVKRSTANTAGTSAAVTATPHDSADACTATVLSYSANPTTGNLVGSIRSQQVVLTNSTTVISDTVAIWDFTTRNSKGVVLRGVAQVLAINLRGTTITGGVIATDVEWTEE